MKNSFLILLLTLLVSCINAEKKDVQIRKRTEINSIQKHVVKTRLEQNTLQTINAWKEYTTVDDHLKKFTAISANEALNNAIQLTKSVKLMKDSIRPKELVNPSFRARINVLENEALRLKDMTFIPAITANEINLQVDKIMEAFSATNSKINTIYSQLEVEKEIETNTTIKKIPLQKTRKN